MLSHIYIYILQPLCSPAGLLYLLFSKPAVRYSRPAEIYNRTYAVGLNCTRRKKIHAEAIYYDLDYV